MSYRKKDPMIGLDSIKHLITYLEREIAYCDGRITELDRSSLADYYKGKRDGYTLIHGSLTRTMSYYENGIPLETTQLDLPLPTKEEE